MTWLRLYTDVVNDPKVQQLPADTFRGWINLLCLAKETDGYLPPIATIAFKLRLSTKDAVRLVKTLIKAGLFDETETGITPHNWNGRQYLSDVSTTRVQRFRKRHRNVSVTAPEQSRAEADSETEEDPSQEGKVSCVTRLQRVRR